METLYFLKITDYLSLLPLQVSKGHGRRASGTERGQQLETPPFSLHLSYPLLFPLPTLFLSPLPFHFTFTHRPFTFVLGWKGLKSLLERSVPC